MKAEQFQADLDELNGELRLSTYFDGGKSRQSSAEDWNHVFGDLSPKQLYERFAKTAGEAPIRIQINFTNAHGNNTGFTRIKIRHDSRIHFGSEYENEIRFDIYPNETPKLDGIFLDKDVQNTNMAKRYLRTGVDLLRNTGADAMRLEAVSVGAYAWAKYGFTPATADDWKKLKQQIKERINDDGTLTFNRHRYDISLEKPVIDTILTTDFADLPKTFPLLTELNREIGSRKGHPLTVGKALLIDTKWHAILPFDEQHVSFQRFNHYTDGATKDLQRRAI